MGGPAYREKCDWQRWTVCTPGKPEMTTALYSLSLSLWCRSLYSDNGHLYTGFIRGLSQAVGTQCATL